LTRGLAFLESARPAGDGYLTRLARLRWARATRAERVAEWRQDDSAADALAGADSWVFVSDPAALPAQAGDTAAVHTLRELEAAPQAPRDAPRPASPAARSFRTAGFPALPSETIENYIRRLLNAGPPEVEAVAALAVVDASERERSEVAERLPAGPARILDVGCGAGGLALARARRPAWRLTGVERDPLRAARAGTRYDRVVEGEAAEVLTRLEASGERFDAFVFADVLEHLEDPVGALASARRLADPGARLVAVVPNVGHLSIVRDLLLGRHDPVPAGLCDAGHLRWFTRASLAENLEEAGWSVDSLEGMTGAPPPDPEGFLELVREWPDADRESLATYQWIATARAR
jgi:SAM-dependent methyltransferase